MEIKQVLTRVYVTDMDAAINFYEELFNIKCVLRFRYQEVNLELAQVENILLLCGAEASLNLFRDTKATFLVDSINEYRDYLLERGATIIRDLNKVPSGKNMTVKHPDGVVIEYVEFDKSNI